MHKKIFDLEQDIVQLGYCSGCGLCESIASKEYVEIQFSKSGYLRPVVKKEVPIQALAEISQVCPGVNIQHQSQHHHYHPIWGPYESVHTGHAVDSDVRYRGSSGGVISALAIHLLETGQVNFVAQTAVSTDDPLENSLQLSRTPDDVLHAAGSRYAPSAPLKEIVQLFETGEKFAFIGKPCDVAALRNYLHQHPALQAQVPFLISFMCAGIPSQHGTHAILEHFSVRKENVKTMRYRGDGWPGKAKIETRDGQSFEMDYANSWGSILNRYLQFRCKVCPDGTGEFADIVCADAWYGEDGYPDFTEQAGRSLIIARTEKGQQLLDQAMRQHIEAVPLPLAEISKMQPYQLHRKSVILARLLGTWLVNRVVPQYKQMSLIKAMSYVSPVEWLRNVWGTFRRVKKET